MVTTTRPQALTEYIVDQSVNKTNRRLATLILQGFLAGLYIAMGAIASLKLSSSVNVYGLGDFFGSLVFPFGIIAVIVMQAELFTSDCMVMNAVYARRISVFKAIRFLCVILLSNLLGAVFAALFTRLSGAFDVSTIKLVSEKAFVKVNMPFGRLFASSILCNIIVCTGVCMAYRCKGEVAKIIVLWLSIAVFVISGTEHVVANMYYLFVSLFCGADLSAIDIFYNLSVSGVGNFIGGGVIIAAINHAVDKTNAVKS